MYLGKSNLIPGVISKTTWYMTNSLRPLIRVFTACSGLLIRILSVCATLTYFVLIYSINNHTWFHFIIFTLFVQQTTSTVHIAYILKNFIFKWSTNNCMSTVFFKAYMYLHSAIVLQRTCNVLQHRLVYFLQQYLIGPNMVRTDLKTNV